MSIDNGDQARVDAVDYVMGLIDMCRGFSDRDTHRAYWLGARVLGLRYKDACRLFKFARLEGAERALKRCQIDIAASEDPAQVYFAGTPDGWIKIGHSIDPERRIRRVSAEIGKPLRLIEARRGFMLHEHVYHMKAKAAWLGGEFYDAEQLAVVPLFAFLDTRINKPEAA